MKIAHFPGDFLPIIGGAQIAVHNIAKYQRLKGHEVKVIVKNQKALDVKRRYLSDFPYEILPLKNKSFGVISLGEKMGFDLKFYLLNQLKKLQRKNKFDLWHFNLATEQAIYTIPLLKKMGVPSVVTCRGCDIQKMASVGYGLRLNPEFEEKFLKTIPTANFFTAISNSVAEEYRELGISEQQIAVIPNGLEVDRIRDVPVDKAEFRKKVGWPIDKKIIITIGRNHPKKGYILIPDIIKIIKDFRKDFLWVIIGKNCEAVYEKAVELKVESHLLIMDELGIEHSNSTSLSLPTDDIIMAYKASDLFAFPTLIETFGNVQIEAMAAGIPVITTDAPGARDLVFHKENGLVSKVGDIKGMADNILELFQDKEMYNTLVYKGLQYVEGFYWKDVADKYLRVYENIIKL